MGGFGSGRHGGRSTTDDMHALDIRKIARAGQLSPGQSFGWQWTCNDKEIASIHIRTDAHRVSLDYRVRDRGGEWQPMCYPVHLTWSSCNFGGQRAWWLCPVAGCGRRVAVLYGGKVYACRHCHQLTYRTQRELVHDRACSKADKLRDRLGWPAGILNGNGVKPKGMHWRTFDRLEAEHDSLVNQTLAGAAARFGDLA
jgi:hypothetical protein